MSVRQKPGESWDAYFARGKRAQTRRDVRWAMLCGLLRGVMLGVGGRDQQHLRRCPNRTAWLDRAHS